MLIDDKLVAPLHLQRMLNAVRLKLILSDIDPSPSRVIDVPLTMNLTGLHKSIQAAFLWKDRHLWEFRIADKHFGPRCVDKDVDGVFNPDNKRLAFLLRTPVDEFSYVYDFGDGWVHRVEVLELVEVTPGARLPALVDCAYRAPPEDIGGPPGFAHFLECLRNPEHPEHDDMMKWYGKTFDSEDIDEDGIKGALHSQAMMRPPVS